MMAQCDIPNRQSGFTLVEMMVALLIFSMLSVAGVILLRSAVDSNEVTARNLGEMAAMQRFVSLMEADLSQAIPRPNRDQQGERVAAFTGAGLGDQNSFLGFTSGGKTNLNDAPRSNLQRIQYRLEKGRIVRTYNKMTDGGTISDPAPLLENISDLQVRYRDKKGLWSREWRTERRSDMPRAIELQFEQDGRSYRHLFLVGTGYL